MLNVQSVQYDIFKQEEHSTGHWSHFLEDELAKKVTGQEVSQTLSFLRKYEEKHKLQTNIESGHEEQPVEQV